MDNIAAEIGAGPRVMPLAFGETVLEEMRGFSGQREGT
jgi:hypothetical protein